MNKIKCLVFAALFLQIIFLSCMFSTSEKYLETRGAISNSGFYILPSGEKVVLLKHLTKYDLYSSWNGNHSYIKWQRWDLCQYDRQGQTLSNATIYETTDQSIDMRLESLNDSFALISGGGADYDSFVVSYNLYSGDTMSALLQGRNNGVILLLSDTAILLQNYSPCISSKICSTGTYKCSFSSGNVRVLKRIDGGYQLGHGVNSNYQSTFVYNNTNKQLLKLDLESGVLTRLDTSSHWSFFFVFGNNGCLEYNDNEIRIGVFEDTVYRQTALYENLFVSGGSACSVDSSGQFLVYESHSVELIELPALTNPVNLFSSADSLVSSN